jgi:hypothetical protein
MARPLPVDYLAMTAPGLRTPLVERFLDEIQNRAGIMLSGEAYQSWRSQLSAIARDEIQNTRNVPRAQAPFDIVDALDDAMDRTMQRAGSPDLGRFRELRRQWGSASLITDAIGTGDKANDFDVSKLAQAVKSRNPRAYAQGRGDLAQLARDADVMLQDLPAHHRNWWYIFHAIGTAAGALTGHAPITAGVLAAEPVIGRTTMADPVQRYLRNQTAVPQRGQVPPWTGEQAAIRSLNAAAQTDALSQQQPNDALR